MTRLQLALPKEWATCRLGDILDVIRGASPRPKGDPRYFGGDIPWISIRDVTREPSRYLRLTAEGVTPAGAEKSRLLPPGTLILSNSATVCIPKILAVAGCIHDGFVAFPTLPSGVDQMYLFEFFNMIRAEVRNEHRQGATQVNLNTDIVRNFELPLPPRPEQQRIVDAIESYFTRLDDAVATLERVERNLKRYRASVLKSAVEGRLVPTEAALAKHEGRDYEPASVLLGRILAERRRRWSESGKKGKYQEPTPPQATDLPDLPEGWCWATLEQLCSTVTDGDHLPPPQTETGIPFLVIGNVRDGDVDLSATRFVSAEYYEGLDPTRRPQRGDILYTVTGSFGIPVLVRTEEKFCVQRHIAILKPLPSVCGPLVRRFLESQFVFRQATAIATGTAQKTVSLKGLRRIVVPLPPAREQPQILASLERHLSLIESVDQSVCRQEDGCARLRQSVLKWAFEGRLADQDSNDEPASVLLERIKTERDARKTEQTPRSPRAAEKKQVRA